MKEKKRYFVSFVEEFWPGQKEGASIGRVEVYERGQEYAVDELRWGTRDVDGFLDFENKWDFKELSESELASLKEGLKAFREQREEKESENGK